MIRKFFFGLSPVHTHLYLKLVPVQVENLICIFYLVQPVWFECYKHNDHNMSGVSAATGGRYGVNKVINGKYNKYNKYKKYKKYDKYESQSQLH